MVRQYRFWAVPVEDRSNLLKCLVPIGVGDPHSYNSYAHDWPSRESLCLGVVKIGFLAGNYWSLNVTNCYVLVTEENGCSSVVSSFSAILYQSPFIYYFYLGRLCSECYFSLRSLHLCLYHYRSLLRSVTSLLASPCFAIFRRLIKIQRTTTMCRRRNSLILRNEWPLSAFRSPPHAASTCSVHKGSIPLS